MLFVLLRVPEKKMWDFNTDKFYLCDVIQPVSTVDERKWEGGGQVCRHFLPQKSIQGIARVAGRQTYSRICLPKFGKCKML